MDVAEMAKEAFKFICTVQFWRMAVFWNLSLIFSYLKLYSQSFLLSKSKRYSRCSPKDHNSDAAATTRLPVCIITGATSGLGAAAVCALSKEGFYVILAGRSSERLSKVISDVKSQNSEACLKAFQLDLSSLKSILKFKSSLHQWLIDSNIHPSIQLLINNAGILATSCRFTSEGQDQIMATNYIGAFCLTKVLLPLLENSPFPSRVVNVTSFTHWSVWCAQADRETVSGSAVDPGVVKTNIMREFPSCVSKTAYIVLKLLGLLQSSEIGVSSIVDAALAPSEVSGVYFFGGNGRSLSSSNLSYDARLAKDLWATSCNLFQELESAS